jgi:hypothetical protein
MLLFELPDQISPATQPRRPEAGHTDLVSNLGRPELPDRLRQAPPAPFLHKRCGIPYETYEEGRVLAPTGTDTSASETTLAYAVSSNAPDGILMKVTIPWSLRQYFTLCPISRYETHDDDCPLWCSVEWLTETAPAAAAWIAFDIFIGLMRLNGPVRGLAPVEHDGVPLLLSHTVLLEPSLKYAVVPVEKDVLAPSWANTMVAADPLAT